MLTIKSQNQVVKAFIKMFPLIIFWIVLVGMYVFLIGLDAFNSFTDGMGGKESNHANIIIYLIVTMPIIFYGFIKNIVIHKIFRIILYIILLVALISFFFLGLEGLLLIQAIALALLSGLAILNKYIKSCL